MAYATQDDIVDAYGPNLLIKIADNDRDGVPDADVVERGLRSADGIINSYLEGRYSVPLAGTSDVLIEIAVDLAIYKIALLRAGRTEEMRVRYDDALCLLEKMAAGKIGTGVTTPGGDGGSGTGPGGGTLGMMGRSINTRRA